MEFGGMSLMTIAENVRRTLGGVVHQESEYRASIEQTSIGRVGVEFDACLFSDFKLKGFLEQLPFQLFPEQDLPGSLERLLASAAARFVPFELVFPPVPISRLHELEPVRELMRCEAEGTGMSIFNAFGLHLNPEVPDLKAPTTLRYLRAFLCLDQELQRIHQVDITRALSPYVDPFPNAYAAQVLSESYRPDWPEFIADYLRHNPTRNRPLDLLPLLAEINETVVVDALPGEKINRRPTLHYRMPNCQIDEPDWTITAEWNRWVAVEKLAYDESALTAACDRALSQRSSSI